MFKRPFTWIVIVVFAFSLIGPYQPAHADLLNLPAPGSMVNLSPAYQPALIKGLTIHQDNPFLFDFIVDTGKSNLSGEALKTEGSRLVKYFFACLTVPQKDLWVNLSPYEKDRMIPSALGQTALGRDLLAQDYILKQLTASLIYPEKDLGKEFWDRVYAKAQAQYGTSQIPVNTFNKVWIVADKASVYENGQTAFVLNGHLKVMLEEDYEALKEHQKVESGFKSHTLSSQVIREIVLPALETEVNTGKNFATLRQIFYAQILATWYKQNLKEALFNQVYADRSIVKGVNLNDPSIKERIYEQYLRAYKKGVFNYIKEEGQGEAQRIPRKYFSGGFFGASLQLTKENRQDLSAGDLADMQPTGSMAMLSVLDNINGTGVAMQSSRLFEKATINNAMTVASKYRAILNAAHAQKMLAIINWKNVDAKKTQTTSPRLVKKLDDEKVFLDGDAAGIPFKDIRSIKIRHEDPLDFSRRHEIRDFSLEDQLKAIQELKKRVRLEKSKKGHWVIIFHELNGYIKNKKLPWQAIHFFAYNAVKKINGFSSASGFRDAKGKAYYSYRVSDYLPVGSMTPEDYKKRAQAQFKAVSKYLNDQQAAIKASLQQRNAAMTTRMETLAEARIRVANEFLYENPIALRHLYALTSWPGSNLVHFIGNGKETFIAVSPDILNGGAFELAHRVTSLLKTYYDSHTVYEVLISFEDFESSLGQAIEKAQPQEKAPSVRTWGINIDYGNASIWLALTVLTATLVSTLWRHHQQEILKQPPTNLQIKPVDTNSSPVIQTNIPAPTQQEPQGPQDNINFAYNSDAAMTSDVLGLHGLPLHEAVREAVNGKLTPELDNADQTREIRKMAKYSKIPLAQTVKSGGLIEAAKAGADYLISSEMLNKREIRDARSAAVAKWQGKKIKILAGVDNTKAQAEVEAQITQAVKNGADGIKIKPAAKTPEQQQRTIDIITWAKSKYPNTVVMVAGGIKKENRSLFKEAIAGIGPDTVEEISGIVQWAQTQDKVMKPTVIGKLSNVKRNGIYRLDGYRVWIDPTTQTMAWQEDGLSFDGFSYKDFADDEKILGPYETLIRNEVTPDKAMTVKNLQNLLMRGKTLDEISKQAGLKFTSLGPTTPDLLQNYSKSILLLRNGEESKFALFASDLMKVMPLYYFNFPTAYHTKVGNKDVVVVATPGERMLTFNNLREVPGRQFMDYTRRDGTRVHLFIGNWSRNDLQTIPVNDLLYIKAYAAEGKIREIEFTHDEKIFWSHVYAFITQGIKSEDPWFIRHPARFINIGRQSNKIYFNDPEHKPRAFPATITAINYVPDGKEGWLLSASYGGDVPIANLQVRPALTFSELKAGLRQELRKMSPNAGIIVTYHSQSLPLMHPLDKIDLADNIILALSNIEPFPSRFSYSIRQEKGSNIIDIRPAPDFSAAMITLKPARRHQDNAINGGIDLNSANMSMTVTKDAHGGVQVSFNPALIAQIRKEGVYSATPIIINVTSLSQAQLRPLLNLP